MWLSYIADSLWMMNVSYDNKCDHIINFTWINIFKFAKMNKNYNKFEKIILDEPTQGKEVYKLPDVLKVKIPLGDYFVP